VHGDKRTCWTKPQKNKNPPIALNIILFNFNEAACDNLHNQKANAKQPEHKPQPKKQNLRSCCAKQPANNNYLTKKRTHNRKNKAEKKSKT
jgi:hypothetical protein